ncbi:MAG TPA: HmuY family protein, partial [Rubricoccaceae bacterium]
MFRSLLAVALAGLTLSACDTVDPVTPVDLSVQTATNVAADPTTGRNPTTGAPVATGRFALYSLRTNSLVLGSNETDRSDSTSGAWDIGFRGTDIIANGSGSGPSLGGIQVLESAFVDVATAPLDGYLGAITRTTTPNWYTYTGTGTNLILPTAGRTVLVRTADGAGYAKVQIRSYYQNAPATPDASVNASRYYTFDFVLNPTTVTFVETQ